MTKQKDGTLLAQFALADLTEVKSWILSFGAKAMVEEPEELRDICTFWKTVIFQR
ncbi:MAG: WYL domain-containing protein [Planctomycetaceae bacterium]|nr:WYL domain-containing protein [Planctomycetaceae bacterium]